MFVWLVYLVWIPVGVNYFFRLKKCLAWAYSSELDDIAKSSAVYLWNFKVKNVDEVSQDLLDIVVTNHPYTHKTLTKLGV
jgi:hypothetical protein